MVLFILAVSNPCHSQQNVEAPNRGLLNLPSSPLRLRVANNDRDLEIINHSFGTVTGYQLGCVVAEASKIKVENRFPAVKLKNELDPADPLDKKEWFTVTDFSFRDLCREKVDKLAVICVSFADGSEWMIRQ
jgi:hypothetical protein